MCDKLTVKREAGQKREAEQQRRRQTAAARQGAPPALPPAPPAEAPGPGPGGMEANADLAIVAGALTSKVSRACSAPIPHSNNCDDRFRHAGGPRAASAAKGCDAGVRRLDAALPVQGRGEVGQP